MDARTDMALAVGFLLQLSFFLISSEEGQVEPCRVEIHQPCELTVPPGARTTILPCHVTHTCTNMATPTHWFVFRHASHQKLYIQLPKYSSEGQNLIIHSALANDSGVYYCATTPTASSHQGTPSIGSGTRLVVRESQRSILKQALLWSLVAILALYSLLILSLLVSRKIGCATHIYRLERRNTSRKSGSTRRRHFRAVVQELYGKRNLRSTGQNTNQSTPRAAGRDTNHTQPHLSKIEHPYAHESEDDVYQNM